MFNNTVSQNTYFGTLLTLAVTTHRQVQLSDRLVYRVCFVCPLNGPSIITIHFSMVENRCPKTRHYNYVPIPTSRYCIHFHFPGFTAFPLVLIAGGKEAWQKPVVTCVWRRSMQRPYMSLALCCEEEGTSDSRVREDCRVV